MQARILALLRDDGPLSRVQLADRMSVSRTTIAAEVARLAELGLAQEVGQAASRGGRRSTMVDLADDIRFVGISIGATGDVRGGHRRPGRRCSGTRIGASDIRLGPETGARRRADRGPQACWPSCGVDQVMGAGIGVPGPVDFHRGVSVSPPIMPGWDGYPVRDAVSRELGCPASSTTTSTCWRSESSTPASPGAPATSCSSRSAPVSAAASSSTASSTAASTAAPATSGTSGSRSSVPPAPAATPAASRRSRVARPSPATPPPPPAPVGRPPSPRCSSEKGVLTAADVGVALSQGDAQAVQLIRDSGRRVGQVLASLVSFFNPGLIVIGGRRHRARARAARRDPRCDLPPLAPARHRQPADRAERAGRRGRGRSAPPA